jgi:hypothetical protein
MWGFGLGFEVRDMGFRVESLGSSTGATGWTKMVQLLSRYRACSTEV